MGIIQGGWLNHPITAQSDTAHAQDSHSDIRICENKIIVVKKVTCPSPEVAGSSFTPYCTRILRQLGAADYTPELQPTPEQSTGLQFASGLSEETVSLVNSRARVGFFVFSVKLKDEK
ncbi:hypothetical protein TNCV_2553541 [Trichonephila clavipes]|nr:hypothetical protein TNCV_2553541 [Trichonephila clavipes]